jgi:hypothetical protein
MRSDIVPGAAFPDYELPDHTRTLRRLIELQGIDPLILTLARGHFFPKDHQQHLEIAAFYPRSPRHTPRSPPSPPMTTTRSRSSVGRLARSGPFSLTQTEPFRRTSTFRSTPTPRTTR